MLTVQFTRPIFAYVVFTCNVGWTVDFESYIWRETVVARICLQDPRKTKKPQDERPSSYNQGADLSNRELYTQNQSV
jgi:hypothetical protein